MRGEPEIVKQLRNEERIGLLTGMSQGSYERLDAPLDVLENMSDKHVIVMKDASKTDSIFSESKRDDYILNAISDWVCLLNTDRRIISTNLAVEKMMGVASSEAIGQTCCKIVHGSDKPLSGCPLKKMVLSRKRESLEIQIPDSNRWLNITVDPVKDEKENVVGALHIVSDITECKQAEEKIKESEDKFRNLFENMSSGVAVYEATDDGDDFVFKDFNKSGEKIDNVKKKWLYC